MNIYKTGALVTMVLVQAISCLSQDGKWQVLKTNNEVAGRSDCGMASIDGKLYLLGGDGAAHETDVFDLKSSTWTKKALAPVAMHHFQAVDFDEKVYVLEAFSGDESPNQIPLPNVMIYDTKKDAWQKGGEIPVDRRRAAAGAVQYKGKLYLVAGIQHGHVSGTTGMFDMYDPKSGKWTALPDAPNVRDHCSATVIKDKLYVVGGKNTSYHETNDFMPFFNKPILYVDSYDFNTGKWITLPAQLPLGSAGGALVSLNNILYYMGGERATTSTPNGPKKNTYYLDPASDNEWKETDSLHFPRSGMAAVVVDDQIYAAGGAGSSSSVSPEDNNSGGTPVNNKTQPLQNNMAEPVKGSIALEVFKLK